MISGSRALQLQSLSRGIHKKYAYKQAESINVNLENKAKQLFGRLGLRHEKIPTLNHNQNLPRQIEGVYKKDNLTLRKNARVSDKKAEAVAMHEIYHHTQKDKGLELGQEEAQAKRIEKTYLNENQEIAQEPNFDLIYAYTIKQFYEHEELEQLVRVLGGDASSSKKVYSHAMEVIAESRKQENYQNSNQIHGLKKIGDSGVKYKRSEEKFSFTDDLSNAWDSASDYVSSGEILDDAHDGAKWTVQTVENGVEHVGEYIDATSDSLSNDWDEFQEKREKTNSYSNQQSDFSTGFQQVGNDIDFAFEAVGSLINNKKTQQVANDTGEMIDEVGEEIKQTDAYKYTNKKVNEISEEISEVKDDATEAVNEYLDENPTVKKVLNTVSSTADEIGDTVNEKVDEGIDYAKEEIREFAKNHPEATRNLRATGKIAQIVPLVKVGKLKKLIPNKSIIKQFNKIYDKAPQAKIEIDNLADKISDSFHGKVAKAPIKSKERAMEKIMNNYRGDPSQIKDLARNTIIVPENKINNIVKQLNKKKAKVKKVDGAIDPLGYSGVNAKIKTKSGIWGEIQVNTPEMIYAKEPEEMARKLLGNKRYDEIAKKTGVEGGLGHKFYEEWRVLNPKSVEAEEISKKSREYYESIRKKNAN